MCPLPERILNSPPPRRTNERWRLVKVQLAGRWTILRSADVAHYLGVSKQRVSQLASEPGFPRDRLVGLAGFIWSVIAAARSYPSQG